MRCPRFSPRRASSEYRAAAAPLCLYAFRGTTVGIRGGSGAVLSPTGPDMAHRTPRAAEIESLNIAPLLPDFGSIGRAPCGRPIQPKSGSRGAPHAAPWGSQYAAPWTRPDSRLTFSRLGRSCNLTTKPMGVLALLRVLGARESSAKHDSATTASATNNHGRLHGAGLAGPGSTQPSIDATYGDAVHAV